MSKQLDKFKAKFSKFQKKNKDLNQKNARMHVKNVGKHYQGAKFNAEGYFIEALVARCKGGKIERGYERTGGQGRNEGLQHHCEPHGY